ncbi:MAG TPA: hypothetical protein VFS40_05080 [Gemmatimonadales bacterium]|nr:hypothetical protein [Gemmatimonadales bacterium]
MAACAALAGVPGALHAQAAAPGQSPDPAAGPTARQVWQLNDLRAAYCVDFLVPPRLADKALPRGLVPLRADRVPALNPVLKDVIAQTDSFAAWSPSEVCAYFSGATTIGTRRVADRNRPQVFAVWSIWAAPAEEGKGAPVRAAVTLRAADWHATELAKQVFLDFDGVDASVGKVPESTLDDRYTLAFGKTTVTWDGHLTGDTLQAGQGLDRAWWTEGNRNTTWTVRASFQPTGARLMVGSLRVSGKDNLAKALKASPVRWVGPMYWGGDGRIDFLR